jgi:hypothetical protein
MVFAPVVTRPAEVSVTDNSKSVLRILKSCFDDRGFRLTGYGKAELFMSSPLGSQDRIKMSIDGHEVWCTIKRVVREANSQLSLFVEASNTERRYSRGLSEVDVFAKVSLVFTDEEIVGMDANQAITLVRRRMNWTVYDPFTVILAESLR